MYVFIAVRLVTLIGDPLRQSEKCMASASCHPAYLTHISVASVCFYVWLVEGLRGRKFLSGS